MRRSAPPWPGRYTAAGAATLFAAFVAVMLDRHGTQVAPFPLFLAAVMLASWYGGLGAGLLAVTVGASIILYVFVEPSYSLRLVGFREAEELIVSVLIAVMISTLNNRRRSAEARAHRTAARMSTLAATSQTFSATVLDLSATLETVARRTAEVLGDGSAVHILPHEREGPDRIVVFHRDPAVLAFVRDQLERTPATSPAAGVVARVLRSGQPLLVSTVRPETMETAVGPAGRACADRHELSSLLVVPLRARGRVFGALTAWRDRPGHAYTAEEQEFLGAVAERAALAIDNAWLYADVQAAETHYRSLFDGAADAILVSDAHGRFLDANPAAIALLGYAREELLCSGGRAALGDRAPLAADMERLRAQPWRGDFDVRRQDGTSVPVEGETTLVSLPTGILMRTTLRDISERRSLQRLQREFIAGVSHDLRTPLTALRAGLGALGMAAADRLRPAEQDLLDNVRRNTDRLDGLITDLLAVSQLEAGMLRLDYRPFDLRAAIVAATSTVQLLIEGKGQVLTLDLPAPLTVHGDPRRLEQVMVNLIGNAHRHTPPATRIAVSARAHTAGVCVTVADDGPGIPPEELDRVFERFRRLGSRSAGTGLGLTIVRGIVELHGGRVWAESRPEEGTAFHVFLPERQEGRVDDTEAAGGG